MKKMPLFRNLKNALIFFTGVHILTSLIMGWVGTSSILRNLHNDQGIWNFALDSTMYQAGAYHLCDVIHAHGWWAWLIEPAWVHERLYSLPFYFLGRSIFSAIAINTPLYILTIWLVYKIGSCLFNETIGFWSLWIAGLLPSYLLHSTQLLRESVLVPAQLAFLYGLISQMQTNTTLSSVVSGGLFALGGFVGIWSTKNYITGFYNLIWGVGLTLQICVILKRHLLKLTPLIGISAVLLLCFTLIQSASGFYQRHLVRAREVTIPTDAVVPFTPMPPLEVQLPPPPSYLTGIPKWIPQKLRVALGHEVSVIAGQRDGFRRGYPLSLSNIDTDVAFHNLKDVIYYSPRALMIGLLAPFPSMWIERGRETGRIGRLISGFEMCLMYLGLGLAVISIWKEKGNPSIWPLVLFILLGLLLHSLVITNVGCLYRFRYIYWFVIIILAMRTVTPDTPTPVSLRS